MCRKRPRYLPTVACYFFLSFSAFCSPLAVAPLVILKERYRKPQAFFIYSGDHVELRKRIKQNMARKMAEVKSRKRKEVLMASFYGMAKHADCNNLFKTLTGKEMKNFKELGVSYAPADGKKRFPGPSISIRELVNLPIIVKDYEVGIKTDQGDDRTLVAIEKNGEPYKFFTASVEMKNILEQIRDMPDGFPFETTIKAETFGKGKTKYIFT